MTIILAILCFISISQFGLLLYLAYEMRTYSRESEQMTDILKRQNILLDDNGKLFDRVTDTVSDLINTLLNINRLLHDHDKRIEETNEWITSVDDNIADMRKDIQEILEKFNDDDFQYLKGTLKRAREIKTNSIFESNDYSALYDKLFSKLPPNNTYLGDKKGDEANEQT